MSPWHCAHRQPPDTRTVGAHGVLIMYLSHMMELHIVFLTTGLFMNSCVHKYIYIYISLQELYSSRKPSSTQNI